MISYHELWAVFPNTVSKLFCNSVNFINFILFIFILFFSVCFFFVSFFFFFFFFLFVLFFFSLGCFPTFNFFLNCLNFFLKFFSSVSVCLFFLLLFSCFFLLVLFPFFFSTFCHFFLCFIFFLLFSFFFSSFFFEGGCTRDAFTQKVAATDDSQHNVLGWRIQPVPTRWSKVDEAGALGSCCGCGRKTCGLKQIPEVLWQQQVGDHIWERNGQPACLCQEEWAELLSDTCDNITAHVNQSTAQDLCDSKTAVERLKAEPFFGIKLPHIPIHEVRWATVQDASWANAAEDHSQGTFLVGSISVDRNTSHVIFLLHSAHA